MFCSNSIKIVIAFDKTLKDGILNNNYEYTLNDLLCIHSKSIDKFQGNREQLMKILHFIFSPSVTTGIEYLVECIIFCYVKGTNSLNPEQVLQQVGRGRKCYELNILFIDAENHYLKYPSFE